MAKALNLIPASTFPPFSCPSRPKRKFSIRATTESSETPVSSASVQTKPEPSSPPLTFTPPPNFKPPEPKRFGVRPDKVFDILGASLALLFRLGTGVFVSGYSFSFVSKDDIPADQYALDFNDSKVKETSKIGPRPQKPIEIYEFEGLYFSFHSIVSVF
ncbi:uncharacterized protein Pyn_23506 [Prunus yedoensis var. nudiflora]|uniref:Uncharacterized protein n=1 Tax=Prunus yedoensis var. nudiflora TaxID=2094558 RepID=A0A314Z9N4_PRUYE|nr:uncharacterized protein Pyn_23506 [Prunus yedoensis var. nudiflora]